MKTVKTEEKTLVRRFIEACIKEYVRNQIREAIQIVAPDVHRSHLPKIVFKKNK